MDQSLNLRLCWVMVTTCCLTATIAICSPRLHAQQERLELGQRLRRFELAWQSATPEVRQRSVDPMKSAVQSFFSFQLQLAGRHLDEAYLTLLPADQFMEVTRFALSRMLKLPTTLSDTNSSKLAFQVEPFYKVDSPAPPGTKVIISLQSKVGGSVHQASYDLEKTYAGSTLPLDRIQEGDYRLRATMQTGNQSIVFAERSWSCIDNLTQRLQKLTAAIDTPQVDDHSDSLSPTDRLSIQQMIRWINDSQSGEALEIDYPAARLLKLCETLVSQGKQTRDIWRRTAELDDTWMTLAQNKQQVVVRLRCPSKPTSPMPVLFSFHGAGGSENMFFETYGAGRLVELALQRGWMVVAPRQGLFGLGMNCSKMLEQLRQCFDIDESQVFLLGHSMGAMQVVGQAQSQPTLPRAAVAVGGGGRLGRTSQPYAFPWLVAAGELDFGRSAAKTLADSLKKTGTPVRYLEYPAVEHMVIVQAALDDIFRFLDESSQR